MSDFDQLIKEKVNSKEYSYSAKNWQSFTQKAGWKGGFTFLHGLLTGAAVVVVAVGIYVAVRLTGHEEPQPTPSAQNDPVTETVIEPDSIQDSIVEPEISTAEESIKPTEEKPTSQIDKGINKPATPVKARKTETQPTKQTDAEIVTTPTKSEPKPVRSERIIHIYEINPDTIPSNDF